MYICSWLVQLLMIQCLASCRGTRPFEITIPLHMASLPHLELTQHPYAYTVWRHNNKLARAAHIVVHTLHPQNPHNSQSRQPLQSAALGMVGCRGRTGNLQLPTIFLPHQLVCGSYTQSAYTSNGLPGPYAALSFVYPLHDLWNSLSVGDPYQVCTSRGQSKCGSHPSMGGGGATASCGHIQLCLKMKTDWANTYFLGINDIITFSYSNSCLIPCVTLHHSTTCTMS